METLLAPRQDAMNMDADVTSPDFIPNFSPLPTVRFNISNNCIRCTSCTKTSLVMTDHDAILKSKYLCGSSRKKKPYANLMISATVRQPIPCLPCPVSFSSDFNSPNPKGEELAKRDPTIDPDDPEIGIPITPGCGCSRSLVEEVVTELNDRKEKRGEMAQMLRLEYMSQKVFRVATQIPVLLNGLGGSHDFVTPPKPDPPVRFDEKSFDVSGFMDKYTCGSQKLTLKPDNVEWEVKRCGMVRFVKQREYAHLGEVELIKSNICCRAVDSDLGPPISPGCGCQKGLVMEIVQEMRHRTGERGSIGQIRRIENMFKQVVELNQEVPKILEKNGTEYPPTQEMMQEVYGDTKVDVDLLQQQGVVPHMNNLTPLENKTFDVTNNWDSCILCFLSCGIAGCTKATVELEENHMNLNEKNNIDDSNAFVPYAQMDSVEIQKTCCCCYEVNEFSPGWGCMNGEVVQQLGAALQLRKVRRAEIAQLKALETMQSTCVELNLQLDMALNKFDGEKIKFPPTADMLKKVYGDKIPAYVQKLEAGPLHIEPPDAFEPQVYDVTNYREACSKLWCGGMKRTLTLEKEELRLENSNCCVQQTSRTPYANVDSLESETDCFCLHELPELANPGCGCSKAYVDEIAQAVSDRKFQRGDIAQLRMMERTTYELLKLDLKTDILMKMKDIAYPPAAGVMTAVFKENAKELQGYMSGDRKFVPPPPRPPRKRRGEYVPPRM